MATVKYSGPIASFHCPTEAEIRSLKVHFSPKQEGSGDPSPENVRPIVGWDGVEVEQRGKNLFDASNPNIISCWINSTTPNKIGPSSVDRTVYIKCLPNTTYSISKTLGNVLAAGYTTELPVTNIQTYSYMRDSTSARQVTVTTGPDAKYLAIWFYDGSKTYDKTVQPEDIYKTLQVEYSSIATSYEPYRGKTVNYEFGVLGKNKFDKNTVTDYYRINGSGEITAQSDMSISDYIPVIPGQQYTLTNEGSFGGNRRHAYYDENKNYIQVIATYSNPMTFTVPNNVYYLRLSLYNDYLNTTQLELGSTATTYEPYNPNHTVYGGWVDLITGEVCEKQKSIALESLDWSGNGNRARASNSIGLEIPSYTIAPDFIAEKYYAASYSTNLTNYPSAMALGSSGFITYYDGETLPSGKMVYKLSEPITYNLPPYSTELKTFLAQNNIWSNADYVEVEYDLHETQSILARKQFIMANQPHIESASGAIASFKTDLRAPLRECKAYFSPVQEGTGDPSPTNVRSISGWTGLEVYKSGKNLFGGSAFKTALQNIMPVSSTDGNTVVYTNVGAALHDGEVIFDKFKSNTQYTVILTASKNSNHYTHIKLVYTDNSYIHLNNISPINTKVTNVYTTNINKSVKSIERAADEYSTVTMYCDECGIFEGNLTANDFVPYSGTTIPVDWTTEAGTIYGGYVDLTTGELVKTYVRQNLGVVSWEKSTNHSYLNNNYLIINGLIIDNDTMPLCYCDKMTVQPYTYFRDNYTNQSSDEYWITFYINRYGNHLVIVASPEFNNMTEAEVNTFMSGVNIYMKLPPDRHTTYTLTPTQLKSLVGANNLCSTANGDTYVKFFRH